MPSFSVQVPADFQGSLRLDKYIASLPGGMNRSKLKSCAIEILVNGKTQKLSAAVKALDIIDVQWDDNVPDDITPENIALSVLYEDENVAVIDKAQGMVTHPAAGNWTGTLVQALAYYRLHTSPIRDAFTDLLEAEQGRAPFASLWRMGIVHRLDKDTSGILITARSAEAEAFLKDEFKLRHTEKYYLAILTGVPEKQSGIIETSVFRDGHSRIRFAASADLSKGKYARSRYKVLRVYGRYSLVLFKIDTGRTHQIRLHAQFIGCPVVGDPLYGKKQAAWKPYGLMLHAYRLCVALPSTRKKAVFTAPPPRRLLTVLQLLRSQQGND